MRGTYLNTATVLVGTAAGLGLRGVLPESLGSNVRDVIGVATVALGVRMFLQTKSPVVPIGAALVGMVIGSLIGIQAGLDALGNILQSHFASHSYGNFAAGFVAASLLFCIGPMTVLGCIEDGLTGKSPLLFVKSIFDGISALFFAAALGVGVVFSAATVLVVQGSLTLGARSLSKATEGKGRIEELTACGGLMLIALGVRILGLKDTQVADILPGLALAPLAVVMLARRRWYP